MTEVGTDLAFQAEECTDNVGFRPASLSLFVHVQLILFSCIKSEEKHHEEI